MNSHLHDRQPLPDGGFLLGLLAGAAVGGGLALLFAPQEGADTRHALATRGQQAGRRISDAYGSVAAQARRRARALTTRAQRPEGSAPGAHAEGESTLVAGHTPERPQGSIANMGGEAPSTPSPVAAEPAPSSGTWPLV